MSDALSALRGALGASPKGMRRIGVPLESYQHPSRPLSQKFLLNMYPEQQPADARNAVALLPTPGAALIQNIGLGPVYAMNDDLPGYLYLVCGTGTNQAHFFRVTFNANGTITVTDLADPIGVPTGGIPDNSFYSIACGPTQAVVCVPPYAYVTNHPSQIGASRIVNNWPSYGASSVTYLDGYFVFTGQTEPEKFFITAINDASDIDALDFASLDAFPNAARKVVTLGRDLWFAGDNGFEIWYDAGNPDFPFRRRDNGIIQRPVASPKSVAIGDGHLFWLSSDGRVYRNNGYQAERVSNSALEHHVGLVNPDPFGSVRNAFVTQPRAGHIVYYINFLNDTTYCFDTGLAKTWFNVSDVTSGTGPSLAFCCTSNNATPMFGDQHGNLNRWSTDPTYLGDALLRQVVLPPLYGAPGVA